jgi:hypothetical protein
MMKKQGAAFCPNGSPFDLKISDFWPVWYPLSSRLGSNLEGLVHWVSRLYRVMTSSRFGGFFRLFPSSFPATLGLLS